MAKAGGAGGLGRFQIAGLVIAGVLALWIGGGAFIIFDVTRPARAALMLDPADLLLQVEEIPFQAGDGVPLVAWFVKGRRGAPVILLAHDLGGARSSLLQTAAALNRAGHPLFILDFRGHGQSGGRGATLGMKESLDLLGALAYLRTRKDVDPERFGVWGIGMGAYAAVLAASEDRQIVALALDGVYPEIAVQLDRLVTPQVPPALRFVIPLVHLLYEPYYGFRLGRASVANRIADLQGRDVLFIASPALSERFSEQQALYAAVPESASGGKNFLEVRASMVGGLYGEDKKDYDEAVVRFFSSYLGRQAPPDRSGRKPLEIREQ